MAGISEVLHARYVDHAYPMHTHDAWALLIVDDGAIRYDLDKSGNHHGAVETAVTLLPPGVAHDGRSATPHGFRKRVLYLEPSVLDPALAGAAVDTPTLRDGTLRTRVSALHAALAHPADTFEAESRLAFVGERLRSHLRRAPAGVEAARGLAAAFRDLLDERTVTGVSLAEAATVLHAHPTHLVRAFRRAYGLPPHAYLTGRRVERARALLLAGMRPAEAATAVGFYDQSHLTRHFRRFLATPPAAYGRSAAAAPLSRMHADLAVVAASICGNVMF
ncbi:AraC family transcriptional regulator [Virgisporangium ochraceum]|uniref:AraC family transcriptional regulator n=1 Tax=Virgisporangium ochraceum TaxID=65505 RepID=A0A8J3ZL83_9ACTN|nr:AraC family transcriptional regulator [Virgisporangium ochraceum]